MCFYLLEFPSHSLSSSRGMEKLRYITNSHTNLLIYLHINLLKGGDPWEWIGLWMVAIDRHLVQIVVIDVLFYFYLAAIVE